MKKSYFLIFFLFSFQLLYGQASVELYFYIENVPSGSGNQILIYKPVIPNPGGGGGLSKVTAEYDWDFFGEYYYLQNNGSFPVSDAWDFGIDAEGNESYTAPENTANLGQDLPYILVVNGYIYQIFTGRSACWPTCPGGFIFENGDLNIKVDLSNPDEPLIVARYNIDPVIEHHRVGFSIGYLGFDKYLTIDQRFNSASAGDIRLKVGNAVSVIDGDRKEVPYSSFFSLNQQYSFISVDSAQQNRFYHNWDKGQNVTGYDYINSLTISNLTQNQRATQQPKYTFTPYTQIDGVNQSSGFQFIDPWFVNGSNVQQTTLVRDIGSNQNIFRGQDPSEIDPNRPFYKVKKSTDFNGIGLQFTQWSSTTSTIPQSTPNGNGEYPLVFSTSLSSFNTTAEYKGHLTSNTTGWVQNGMVNFNGKEAVVYQSMNELWLHHEDEGVNPKEIKVAPSSETPANYSVLINGLDTYISYVNNLGKIMLKKYNFNGTLVSTTDLQNTALPSGASPKLIAGGFWQEDPKHINDPVFIQYIAVFYQDGTGIKYKKLTVSTGYWGSWTTQSLSSYLTASTEIQSVTNGQYGYLFWNYGLLVYCVQFTGSFGNFMTPGSYNIPGSGSNIYYVSGAVNSAGNLNLVYTQRRYNDHSVFYRKVNSDNTMSAETQLETYWSTSYQTAPYYSPQVLSAEGSNLLLEIGKQGYYYNPGYIFWKYNGSAWTKQSWSGSLFAVMNPKKLLNGEADDYPKEVIVSSLNKFETAAATTNGSFSKINEGEREEGNRYFSIVAHELSDTNQFYIDLEPASIDSIVVDTLNIWHIVLRDVLVSSELTSDLTQWGSASWSTEEKTVTFQPDYSTYFFYTVDPSSNSARLNKLSQKNQESLSVDEDKVSVFPNPFNPATQIKISVKEKSTVSLSVYNLVGQLVMSETRRHVQGEMVIPFNGSHLSSGTYFYRVTIGDDKIFKGQLKLVK